MLARLDRELAPMRPAVDREGTFLRVHGPGAVAADLAPRIVGIVEELGYFAQPTEDAPEVSRWFGPTEVDELSQEEARVLAERWAAGMEADGVVEDPGLVLASLRDGLLEAMRAAARTGGVAVEDLRIDLSALGAVLSESQADKVRRWVDRQLRRPESHH